MKTSYLPRTLCADLKAEDLARRPLYDTLAETCNVRLTMATEAFEPVIQDDYEVLLLEGSQGSAGLLLERIACGTIGDKRPQVAVQFCEGVVRGDRCRCYVELVRNFQ